MKSTFEKELEGKLESGGPFNDIYHKEDVLKAKNNTKKKILDEIDIQMQYNKHIQPLMNSGLRQALKIIEENL